MESKFAPPEKASNDELIEQYKNVSALKNIREILDALPYVAVILNHNRQIVYSNSVLIDLLNVDNAADIIGTRPGECLHCVNAFKSEGGCGTTENCRYCGAVNAILETQRTSDKSSKECRIISNINGEEMYFDFAVSTTPFIIDDAQYIIMTVNDISNEKRRKVLERIFFHDVINTAGALDGLLELLNESSDPGEMKSYINIAKGASERLIEEIVSQRQLVAAENDELKIELAPVYTYDIMKEVLTQIMHHNVAKEKHIMINENSSHITFNCDPKILRRILLNLVKNALESSDKKGMVTLKCDYDKDKIRFSVNNLKVMSKEVQHQIFQRSFSTKAANRGIGTYSVKLLTEKYLKGKVWFTSDEIFGTTFYVELPL